LSNIYEQASEEGAKVWLKKLLVEMLPALPKDLDGCNHWFDSLIQAFEARKLVEPKQQKNYLTQVRNAIKVIDPEHPALDVVKFDKSTWVEINNSSTDRIAERNTKFIHNPEAIANKAKELVTSLDWSEIAAGLAVLTGRRSSEVIKTAKFSYKTKFSVMFSGSLKRRSEPIDVVFEIPTLCEAELVIDAIARLRRFLGDEIDELSVRQISGRYSRAVAKKCDEHFVGLVPKRDGEDNLYSHLFRAVYATIASHWYCPPTIPEMEYRAAIQGHYQILEEKNPVLRRSLEAGRHYYDYRISDGSGNIDGRLGIKLDLSGVEVVEQFARIISEDRAKDDRNNTPQEFALISQPRSESPREKDLNQIPKKHLLRRKIMNESVTIPRYLMSRLMGLSERLELDEKETLEALFDWAEISLSLAEILEIEELKTNVLYDKVEGLIEKLGQAEVQRPRQKTDIKGTTDDNISINTESIRDLSSSVRILSELLASKNPLPRSINGKNTTTTPTVQRKTSQQGKNEADTTNNKVVRQESSKPEADKTENDKGRKVSQRTIEAEAIINGAIDKIIEFNEQEGITHKEKIRIGIGGVRTLTRRGDNIIRRVLKRREDELEEHHLRHELSSTHNSKGKTAPSIDEVIEFDKDKVIEEICQ